MEYLKDIDFQPLLEVCMEIGESEIEAVNIRSGSSCMLNGEYALLLMNTIDQKLRVVDLQDSSFGKDFIRYTTVFSMHFLLVNYQLILYSGAIELIFALNTVVRILSIC